MFQALVKQFYDQAFLVFYSRADRDPDDSCEDLTCDGCSMTTDACLCSTITAVFHQVMVIMMMMEMMI